ncbi:MAG TPA: type II toxin-antitoxin system VapC family toxin [Bryobacteraceae bacterium]
MSRIYWDTMLFVYWFENNPQYADRVGEIYSKMRQRKDQLLTSAFTLGEILVGPYRRGQADEGLRIRQVFESFEVELIPFAAETAERYGQIRGSTRVTPADAIHLASAGHAGVDLFLTNDRELRDLVIPGIHFIAGLDVNLF